MKFFVAVRILSGRKHLTISICLKGSTSLYPEKKEFIQIFGRMKTDS